MPVAEAEQPKVVSMAAATPPRAASDGLPAQLPPPLSLSIDLLRTTVGATIGFTARTLRACAAVDPAGVVAAVAALPTLADGALQVVQRLAVLAERVETLLDGFEATSARIDRVVGEVGGVVGSASSAIGRVESTVDQTQGVLGR